MGSPLGIFAGKEFAEKTTHVLRRRSAVERRVCALTHLTLGIAERHVVVMVPVSTSGQEGPWELEEIAYVRSDIFDAVIAEFGYEGGRIPGIEPSSSGKVWPSIVRRFHFQTFVATRPEEDVRRLVTGLPFLMPHLQTARRCMTGGDEQRNLLRGTGSTRALRPVATL